MKLNNRYTPDSFETRYARFLCTDTVFNAGLCNGTGWYSSLFPGDDGRCDHSHCVMPGAPQHIVRELNEPVAKATKAPDPAAIWEPVSTWCNMIHDPQSLRFCVNCTSYAKISLKARACQRGSLMECCAMWEVRAVICKCTGVSTCYLHLLC